MQKHVRFTVNGDIEISAATAEGRIDGVLVSPPPRPAQSLLDRLNADIAALPLPLRAAITPTQLHAMAGGEGTELERLEVDGAVTLFEMGRRASVGGAHVARGPDKMAASGPASPERPKVKTKRIILHHKGPKKRAGLEGEGSPEKASLSEATPKKDCTSKAPRTKATASEVVPKKITQRRNTPASFVLRYTRPRKGISGTNSASPERGSLTRGSSKKRNLMQAKLQEYNTRTAELTSGKKACLAG